MARSIHSLAVATSCWNVRWILWRRYRLCDDGNDGRPWYDRHPQHERVTDFAGGHHQSGGSRHLYCGWSRFVAAVPVMILGSIAGGWSGGHYAQKADPKKLRYLVIAVGL